MISCVYVNPETGQFWVIDYRIYDPEGDGKSQLKIRLMPYNRCVISVGKLRSFTPEIKQLTGVESCQCRKARIQRNHINCAMLVWSRLKQLAYATGQTVYQRYHGLLSRLPDSTTQTSSTNDDPCLIRVGDRL